MILSAIAMLSSGDWRCSVVAGDQQSAHIGICLDVRHSWLKLLNKFSAVGVAGCYACQNFMNLWQVYLFNG